MDPQVIVVRDLANAETVLALCDDISEEKRVVIGTIRAKDSAEALKPQPRSAPNQRRI